MSAERDILIERLRALKPELRERFGVRGLSIFGSRARDDARPDSDLDLLLEFEETARPTLFSLFYLDEMIEEAIGLKVDTITSLNPRYEPYIRPDLIPV